MAAAVSPESSLGDLRRFIRDSLVSKYGEREANAMAKTVMMSLKGWSMAQLLANEDRQAGEYVFNRCREIVRELINDRPLQYILGVTNFYGLDLNITPGVLIPRPETEELVDMIVKENKDSDLRVLDLCTGSGAIALALARNLPFSNVTAIDISPEAVALAQENNARLKTKVKVIKEDIHAFNPDPQSFDIVVSNPPYVGESEKAFMEANVLNYEPHLALFVSEEDPLVFYRRISEIALAGLVPGGRLYLEINPRFAESLKEMLVKAGFVAVEIIRDVHGKYRFAKASVAS